MTGITKSLSVFVVLTLMAVSPGFAESPMPVFVSIVPQKYFVEQIGRDRVHVRVMVQPGASPATYEPKPAQMADLSKARLYFSIGVPFEQAWLEKIAAANSAMTVVHTDRDIRKFPMMSPHTHGDAHHHESSSSRMPPPHTGSTAHDAPHGMADPHIWLSPPLVKRQAETILAALQEIDPSHAGIYEANYQQFVAGIDELDHQLKTIFAGKQGLQFMVFHPSWGYFARAYGIEQVPIEIEGKDPKPAGLKALIHQAEARGIKVIFVQPQFSTRSAEVIAREIGGQVVFADPLAENWPDNLRNVAARFEAALK